MDHVQSDNQTVDRRASGRVFCDVVKGTSQSRHHMIVTSHAITRNKQAVHRS